MTLLVIWESESRDLVSEIFQCRSNGNGLCYWIHYSESEMGVMRARGGGGDLGGQLWKLTPPMYNPFLAVRNEDFDCLHVWLVASWSLMRFIPYREAAGLLGWLLQGVASWLRRSINLPARVWLDVALLPKFWLVLPKPREWPFIVFAPSCRQF